MFQPSSNAGTSLSQQQKLSREFSDPDPTPSFPSKKEIDSSTYVKVKNDLKLLANFMFNVTSHSVLLDREGNKIFVLHCGTKGGKVFKVPLTY